MLTKDTPEAASAPYVMEARGISKCYGTIAALDGVSLTVAAGEVIAVVGDNGAGKSTLVKILSGATRPDSGQVLVGGNTVDLSSPLRARELGIETVYQDLALAPNRDAADNMFLGREVYFGGLVSPLRVLKRSEMRTRAGECLASLNVDVPRVSGVPVLAMSGGQRQSVAIARAAFWAARVMFMDEPTAALGVRESASVLQLTRRVADRGVAVVMISHIIPHVSELADRIVVLRQGRKVRELTGNTSTEELVALITGEAE